MPGCPVCSGRAFEVIANAARLDEECHIREDFVKTRLTRRADPDELKDLTDFFHTEAADVLQCDACTLLIRRCRESPPAGRYSKDQYDRGVMEHLYPRYVEAFRKKENPFRHLVPENARVLEVGSHYGAFLQVAKEWNWRAEGVDPGEDTSRFARSKGCTVHTAVLERCSLPAAHFDGVFIWNCFDQIQQPASVLNICRRILRPQGVLTVRTPNGAFYATCQTLLRDEALSTQARDFLLHAMGYNNLLGFPYLYGHNPETLPRLVERYGFRLGSTLNSELLVFPLPYNPPWVEREERRINKEMRLLANSALASVEGDSIAPWIEAWFRAV